MAFVRDHRRTEGHMRRAYSRRQKHTPQEPGTHGAESITGAAPADLAQSTVSVFCAGSRMVPKIEAALVPCMPRWRK